MSETDHRALCPDDVLAGLVSLLEEDGETAVSRLEDLVQRFPADARLHFLRGSLMAGRKDYEGARKAMRRAVDLAPDFAIARFQLGFLLLTSGDGWAAQEAWGPLHGLADGHYLHCFVRGLRHLIHDEFAGAIAELERGIAANRENPPLNGDMRLILDELREQALTGGDGGGEVSSAQLLLLQASLRSTRH
jgi:tetratricopeptide (TPR) repeat protein